MVNNWNTKTPKKFKYTAKFPRVIPHEKRLKDVDKELDRFFEGSSIEQNIGPFDTTSSLLHLHEGLERLRELVPNLDNRFIYAIEVRHSSWFRDLTYNFFPMAN